MKAILLLVVVGFVLAVGFAVPFGDDDLGSKNSELKDIAVELADDFEREDLKRYDANGKKGKTVALIRRKFELGINTRLKQGSASNMWKCILSICFSTIIFQTLDTSFTSDA